MFCTQYIHGAQQPTQGRAGHRRDTKPLSRISYRLVAAGMARLEGECSQGFGAGRVRGGARPVDGDSADTLVPGLPLVRPAPLTRITTATPPARYNRQEPQCLASALPLSVTPITWSGLTPGLSDAPPGQRSGADMVMRHGNPNGGLYWTVTALGRSGPLIWILSSTCFSLCIVKASSTPLAYIPAEASTVVIMSRAIDRLPTPAHIREKKVIIIARSRYVLGRYFPMSSRLLPMKNRHALAVQGDGDLGLPYLPWSRGYAKWCSAHGDL